MPKWRSARSWPVSVTGAGPELSADWAATTMQTGSPLSGRRIPLPPLSPSGGQVSAVRGCYDYGFLQRIGTISTLIP
jgi:hypothetical protein